MAVPDTTVREVFDSRAQRLLAEPRALGESSLVLAADDPRCNWAACVLCVLGFVLFAWHRTQFLEGCDPTAYYLESLRLRGVDAGLSLDPTVPLRGPLAPLCMELTAGNFIATFFPPGFPLLLAVMGAIGFPFHTAPLLGATSALALYYLVKERSNGLIALALLLAWLCSPLVFWGSTRLMSDLPATAFLLFVLLAARRRRWTLAGALLGFAVGIRPAAVLFVPAFIVMESSIRPLLRVALGGLGAVIGWALYLRLSFGYFFFPYSQNVNALATSIWWTQLWFLLKTTALLHAPLVALAIVGTVMKPRAAAPCWVWFGSFAAFHALFQTPFDAFWWTRYVLPALPALFLLAADGAQAISRRGPMSRSPVGVLSLATGSLAYASWALMSQASRESRRPEPDPPYAEDARRVAKLIPAGALVGAENQSGTLRLHGHVQSFFWCHFQTEALVNWAHSVARPVYVLLDEGELKLNCGPATLGLRLVEELKTAALYRVVPLDTPTDGGAKIDVGTNAARQYLLEGWSGDERADTTTFVWAVGHRVVLAAPSTLPAVDTRVRIRLSPFVPPNRLQRMDVHVSGAFSGSYPLSPGYQVVEVMVPARLARQPLELRFASATTPPSSDGKEADARLLAAAVDWVVFEPVRQP